MVPYLKRAAVRDERGRRPVYDGSEKFQSDPHRRDHILFYKYFHGDNGAGLGTSHQTIWTGLVGTIIHLLRAIDPQPTLQVGEMAAFGRSPTQTLHRREVSRR